jgi:urocanate hydratase
LTFKGNALSALAQLAQGSEQLDLLTQAATAYHAALQIYTPEQTSAQWARAQVHLARVQLILASLENDAQSRCAMLQEASQRVEDTLSFFRQEENSVSSQQAIQLYRTIHEQMQASGCHLQQGQKYDPLTG